MSEQDAGRLKVGSLVRVTVSAKPGEAYEGTLAAIAPEVDPKNRHFQHPDSRGQPHAALLSGMYATAHIVVATAEGLIVPREAVFDRNGTRSVYRVDGDRISIVAATEGLSDGTRTVLLSGVKAGDVIVADATPGRHRGRPRAPDRATDASLTAGQVSYMWISNTSIKRPVFATMFILSFVVLGLVAMTRLGIDLFPVARFPLRQHHDGVPRRLARGSGDAGHQADRGRGGRHRGRQARRVELERRLLARRHRVQPWPERPGHGGGGPREGGGDPLPAAEGD